MAIIDRAVVIGGSMAGLAAAATLSPRAREVVVVERRTPVDGGSAAPQGAMPHVMLLAGSEVLERLFPGFAADLLRHGAYDAGDPGSTFRCHWAAADSVRDHLELPDLGFPRAMCSRRLIEARLRAATGRLANVTFLDAGAEGLELTGDAAPVVTGVRLRGCSEPLPAELAVDASGRNSRVGEWLAAAGLPEAASSEVVVDLRYAAFIVERRPDDFGGAAAVIVQNTRAVPRIGLVLPMEANRWQLLLGGYFGDAPPGDAAGARTFAQSLSDPVLAPLLDRPFLRGPMRYTFRSSRRLRWDELRPHPRGLCVLGDAVASFNPIYGQGMSSALLQADALGAMIDRHGTGPDLAPAFARAAAKVVDSPWLIATGSDFVYDATLGPRTPGTAFVNRYVDRVTRAAAVDDSVNAAFTGVQQLLAEPPSLFRPSVVARAAMRGGHRRNARVGAPVRRLVGSA